MQNNIFAMIILIWFEYGVCMVGKREAIRLGIVKKYYPKEYIMPSATLRKRCHMEKKEIPKWCYRLLCMRYVFVFANLVSAIIYILDNELEKLAMDICSFTYLFVFLPIAIYSMVQLFRYDHEKKKQNKGL